MSVKYSNKDGKVEISKEVIASIVGNAITENFGIVGMASKNQVRDGFYELLNKDNYSRGVVIRQEDNSFAIDMYIIVRYGVKISEVSKNAQETVSYQVQKLLGVSPSSVNVFVQGVRN